MRTSKYLIWAAALLAVNGITRLPAAMVPASFVAETDREFISLGDFNADGKPDIVIADRATGRVRVGYLSEGGLFHWAKYVISGVKDVSGVTVGRLFAPNKDSIGLTSADGASISVVEVPKPGEAGTVVAITPPGLGPNTIVALDIGGAGNTALMDLFINTTYNNPTPNQATLLRNEAGKFTKMSTVNMPGAVVHGQRLALAAGRPEWLGMVINGDDSASFRVDSLASGKPESVGLIKEVPAGSDYVLGHFRGAGASDLVFFTSGDNKLTVRSVEAADASVTFGDAKTFEMPRPLKHLFVIPAEGGDKLFATFGTNEAGGLFSFDAAKAPVQIQPLKPNEGELFSGLVPSQGGFVLLSTPAIGKIKYSTRYQQFALSATGCAAGTRGSLPDLDDRDYDTVPAIHKLIVAKLTEKTEADMKAYTNVIPGSAVSYGMVAIPGGEFLMGSPGSEEGRKPDEGPQHQVKIEPFWMGRLEVGWNEYQVFMDAENERAARESMPTDPEVDKVSDAVTRPSAPYVDMSFTMGKAGFPAIAMTHHAANKYCHWLSAKTGHYYRLPTEAEWEYACRAGSTTAYYFGDDVAKLGDYAWFEDNSDIKYQKCGKKKPNKWGLYDMSGNVTEWCLDQFDPNYYQQFADKVAVEPWNKAAKPYPHAVRGGSWDEGPAALRSAARRGSERSWKAQDPQLPKSIWWLTDAKWVGFRIIRPLKVPPPEELVKYWVTGTEKE